jgi:hypothetical protein
MKDFLLNLFRCIFKLGHHFWLLKVSYMGEKIRKNPSIRTHYYPSLKKVQPMRSWPRSPIRLTVRKPMIDWPWWVDEDKNGFWNQSIFYPKKKDMPHRHCTKSSSCVSSNFEIISFALESWFYFLREALEWDLKSWFRILMACCSH